MNNIEFINGITVLYTKYYSNVGEKVLFIIFSCLCVLLVILSIMVSIEDKKAVKLTIPVGLVALILSIACFFISNSITPKIKYVVQIDDTVPYTYIKETLPKIHNEGGNVYHFYLDEE